MNHFLLAAAALLAAGPAAAANLVVNGDFEAGDTGFSSDLVYAAPSGSALTPEGLYTVDTNAANVHPSWVSFGDHTSGTGSYLIGNGSTAPNTTVWESGPFAVLGATNYFFEAFAAEICCNDTYGGDNFAANLTFEITPNVGLPVAVGTFTTTGQTPGDWVGLTNSWNSGTATSVTLRILNSSVAASGNDFAIDDVNFSTRSIVEFVPEPATWAMMIAGFGLVGAAMRRRRPAVARSATGTLRRPC
jgi:hypothetical protein